MYPNSPHGHSSSRPPPAQNVLNGQNDAYRVNDVQRRRTRSTNPFDYDPYDLSHDDSPPPPLPPRPRGLSAAASSRHHLPQRPPPPPPPPLPPHHYPNPPHTAASYSTPSAELRSFPRESDSDLSVPSSTTSSSRPSPSYVAARPDPPAYEYFNNPWAYPPSAHNPTPGGQHQQSGGVYDGGGGGGLSVPPHYDPGLRQRAKSSVDLRSAASLRAQRQPDVSTFVAPTMSFPMPEIPPLPSVPPPPSSSSSNIADDRPHSALGRTTSAHAALVNGARRSDPPSPPRPHPSGRNSVPSLVTGGTTPTSAGPAPVVEEGEGGRKPRRPSSASRPGSSRGEFRFSPNLMKLQHMPSVASISSTSTSSSNFYKEADFEDGFASPTDATVCTYYFQDGAQV